jgi:hypothetical protein
MMSGWELKIDPSKMEAIIKWPIPTFVGKTQYLQKFIASFSTIVFPLHATPLKNFLHTDTFPMVQK